MTGPKIKHISARTLDGDDDVMEPLTRREQEALDLLVAGILYAEIPARMNISPKTLERMLAEMYSKTGTHGRMQLIEFAKLNGLVTRESGEVVV